MAKRAAADDGAAAGAAAAAAAPPTRVGVVLGTMTMGLQTDKETAERMLALWRERFGQRELDTALMYPSADRTGATEKLLGELFAARAAGAAATEWTLASKAMPWGGETLSADGVAAQLERSLASVGRDSLDVFYLHAPDAGVRLSDTLDGVERAFKAGKFRELGISNYAAWQLVQIHAECARRGTVLPTVYQGMYNAVTRDVERELLPAVRALGMRFYAYNASAGGLLTGKHGVGADAAKAAPAANTRFGNDMYYKRFWKEANFAALAGVAAACKAADDMPMVEAAHRWLVHHSALDAGAGDKVIVGASKLAYLEQNTAACVDGGPLPQAIVDALEHMWQATKHDCPSYFRGNQPS